MTFQEFQGFSYIPQYIMLFLLLIYQIPGLRKLSHSGLITLVFLLVLSGSSYLIGVSHGYPVNIKGFIVSIIIYVIYYSRSNFNIRVILKFTIFVLVVEYLLGYLLLPEFHLYRTFVFGFPLMRPIGPFADVHLLSAFFVLVLFITYKKYFWAGIAGFVFMNMQAILMWVVLSVFKAFYARKKGVSVLLVFISFSTLYYALYLTDYLNQDSKFSIVSMSESLIEGGAINKLNYSCILFGCATNWQKLEHILEFSHKGYDLFSDIGYLNLLYQYGLFWCTLVLYKLYRLNRLVCIAVIVSSIHYAVFLGGLVGVALAFIIAKHAHKTEELVWRLKYVNLRN